MLNKLILSLLIIVFLFILAQLFVPVIRDFFKESFVFLLPFVVFSLLGLISILLSWKEKNRKFLLLAGFSSFSLFLFIVLHNAFYAFSMFFDQAVLRYSMEVGSAVSFFMALLICPVVFSVGAIVSLFFKRK